MKARWFFCGIVLALTGCSLSQFRLTRADIDGGDAGVPDGGDVADAVDAGIDVIAIPGAARLIWPQSASYVTTRRPTFHVSLPTGATGFHVDLCRSRVCTTPLQQFDLTGDTGTVTTDVAPGVWFWRARATAGSAQGVQSTPWWEFVVPGVSHANVSSSWGLFFDVNGDTHPDVVIGVPPRTVGGVGHIEVLGHSSTATLDRLASLSLTNGGHVVFAVGDLDGDGFPEFGSAPGSLMLCPGSAGPPDATTPIPIAAPSGTDWFAGSVTSGDFNGDGYADLVAGGVYPSDSTHHVGHAFVYAGSASGVSATSFRELRGPDGDATWFGQLVDGSGDVDGDGYSDLLVSANGYMYPTGRAYVFWGSPGGLSSTSVTNIDPPAGASMVAVSVAGDVDGDGLADILLSTSTPGCGAVFLGASSRTPTIRNRACSSSASLGPFTGVGDLDSDGYGDVAVVDRASNQTLLFEGSALRGVGTSVAATSNAIVGSDTMRAFAVVHGVGDYDGDGIYDFAISETVGASATHLGDLGLYVGATPTVRLAVPTDTIVDDTNNVAVFGAALAASRPVP